MPAACASASQTAMSIPASAIATDAARAQQPVAPVQRGADRERVERQSRRRAARRRRGPRPAAAARARRSRTRRRGRRRPRRVRRSSSSSGAVGITRALVPQRAAQRHLDRAHGQAVDRHGNRHPERRSARRRARARRARTRWPASARSLPGPSRRPRLAARAARAGSRAQVAVHRRGHRRRAACRTNASRSSAYPGRGRTPRARADRHGLAEQRVQERARARGSARIGPTGWRIAQVAPLWPTRNTNFSHSRALDVVATATSMDAARQAAANASSRAEPARRTRPRSIRCIVPVWRITPGPVDHRRDVAQPARDVLRRRAAARSRSSFATPFWSEITAVPGPSSGPMRATAACVSHSLTATMTTSTGPDLRRVLDRRAPARQRRRAGSRCAGRARGSRRGARRARRT